MFANVANMKNLFFENPNDEDIKEIGDIFYLRDAIIPIDTSDIKEVLEGADNAIVLHGKATGHYRCADAIEDAVQHTCFQSMTIYNFPTITPLNYTIKSKTCRFIT